MDKKVVCVDCDGTVVTHEFPKMGKDIGAVPVLKQLVKEGHKIVLFTMRSDRSKMKIDGLTDKTVHNVTGDFLTDAVNWFRYNDIPLYGINTNPTQHEWTSSPKAYGQVYIDDAALGCPLLFSEGFSNKPFVDWFQVYLSLNNMGVLTENITDAASEFIINHIKKYPKTKRQ